MEATPNEKRFDHKIEVLATWDKGENTTIAKIPFLHNLIGL